MVKSWKTHARIIALCAGLPALVLGTGGVVNASTTDTNYSVLYNFNTNNQCLAVGAGSIDNGAGVIQWNCTNGFEQEWSFDRLPTKTFNGSTWYHVVNLKSTLQRGTPMCLAVPGGTSALNTQLMQWPCGDWNDHWWRKISTDYANTFALENLNGLCIGVGGNSHVPGAPVVQWSCDNGPEQSWYPS
ncbi:RICIN domain-containing protein [Kitasatospora sp. NPDC051170]|uniref:RICIN domain-containing protein n=1 Tax=Kitasatospora sp. NPDC051170 TaxID=3364056 RepID=UPI0037AAA68B